MIPTHFLYQAVERKTVQSGNDRCRLCGSGISDSVPVTEVIRDTFTNHGLCRVPSSQSVCLACNHYFNHRWTPKGFKKPAEYRMISMKILADSFHPWQREEMRGDIEHYFENGCPECLLVVSLSKKKHCLPLARVNPAGKAFTIQVEEEQVRIGHVPSVQNLLRAFDGLLAMGCTKGNILSGNYHHAVLRKSSIFDVLELDRVIAPHRPSGLLTLISYITLTGGDRSENSETIGIG